MTPLLLDKPAGITSHDVVDLVRARTGEKTVGHAGTLDPFATGLLLVAVGREQTKHLSEYVGLDKEYIATVRLGYSSTTGDYTGTLTPARELGFLQRALLWFRGIRGNTERDIEVAMRGMLGEQLQTPPMFSAKKVGGKKLYDLARKGETIQREPVPITIYTLELLSLQPALLMTDRGSSNTLDITFRTRVSSGTYVRTLGEELAHRLGTEGYLTQLRRTKIGDFSVEDAVLAEDFLG